MRLKTPDTRLKTRCSILDPIAKRNSAYAVKHASVKLAKGESNDSHQPGNSDLHNVQIAAWGKLGYMLTD